MHAERLEHFLIRVFERPYSLREKEGHTTSQSYHFGDGVADFGQSKGSLPNLKARERSNREGGITPAQALTVALYTQSQTSSVADDSDPCKTESRRSDAAVRFRMSGCQDFLA